VVGCHGCSRETADRILGGEPFLPSRRAYDWLGDGIYVWEYGPFRAYEWAERRFGPAARVLEATIRLNRCLNLLDIEHLAGLGRAYDVTLEEAVQRGETLPENSADGRYYRDRIVVEIYCELQTQASRIPFQTVRACYPEGDPVFPGSRILSRAHVQVAVRDVGCIIRPRLVR
jgi:hypothetical protein